MSVKSKLIVFQAKMVELIPTKQAIAWGMIDFGYILVALRYMISVQYEPAERRPIHLKIDRLTICFTSSS
jgi:hypothetical protein